MYPIFSAHLSIPHLIFISSIESPGNAWYQIQKPTGRRNHLSSENSSYFFGSIILVKCGVSIFSSESILTPNESRDLYVLVQSNTPTTQVFFHILMSNIHHVMLPNHVIHAFLLFFVIPWMLRKKQQKWFFPKPEVLRLRLTSIGATLAASKFEPGGYQSTYWPTLKNPI